MEKCELGFRKSESGALFSVWAPHADSVSVIGDFNKWDSKASPLKLQKDGVWSGAIDGVEYGQEYRYSIVNGDDEFTRVDPYAIEVTNSVGNAICSDLNFDWGDADKVPVDVKRAVIYELHIGTFNRKDKDLPGNFDDAIEALDHLKSLGINAIELMPVAEFAGDLSWGYNPAHPFAVEQVYGGPLALKRFVKACHERKISVIADVVYNHFGPSDLSLWQFDGWSENGKGGIYFYNDWRSTTPWGDTRPDYGRREVRQYITDNARFWLEEYKVDGLRFDMTLFIRHVSGNSDPSGEIPEGWSLTQDVNRMVSEEYPDAITIAEDLQNNEWLTKSVDDGGAGFTIQWDAKFVHPVRHIAIASNDNDRNMDELSSSLRHTYNGDAFQRVVYSESHDEVANGKARVPYEIDSDHSDSFYARKRTLLAIGLVLTAPGVPMFFQGQEFLEDGWFTDTVELDWAKREKYPGVMNFFKDLIKLRLSLSDGLPELRTANIDVTYTHNNDSLLVFRRWDDESGSQSIIAINFSNVPREDFVMPVPDAGLWKCIFNSDRLRYGKDFSDLRNVNIDNDSDDEHVSNVKLGPYSMLIYHCVGEGQLDDGIVQPTSNKEVVQGAT